LVAGLLSLVSLVSLVGALALTRPASAVDDPDVAAELGASWLVGQAEGDGGYGSVGATADVALAYAAAGVGDTAFSVAMEYLRVRAADEVADPNPGQLGKLLLLAPVAGDDPRDFGGADLVAALLATMRTSGTDAGLFGAADPTFDGVFRQSLVLLGLDAVGTAAPPEAVAWLVAQQCDSGGWRSYRADTASPCPPPDPANFSGEDTNSTALAVEALAALGSSPGHDALAWLDSARNAGGGFGFFPGDPTDANSTGLVAQAVVAAGEDPGDGRWASASGSVLTALLDLQLGCEAPAADRGAFVFQAGGSADAFATSQAVPGAARRAFPLEPGTIAPPQVIDCAPATTTTSTAGPPTTLTVLGTSVAALGTSATLPATGARAGGVDVDALAVLGLGLFVVGVTLAAAAHSRRTRQ
jgi:hypothetical protein